MRGSEICCFQWRAIPCEARVGNTTFRHKSGIPKNQLPRATNSQREMRYCFMIGRNRKGICAYCGQERKLTKDHVPPRIFFSKSCPSAMLTVPACEECNQSFKKDDEYTGLVLALDIRAATHRDVIGNLSDMMRTLQYPQGRGFAKYLGRQTTLSPILGTNGVQVRKLTRDLNRLAATGERLVRGLHYVETGKPLTPDARITMSMCADIVRPTSCCFAPA